MSNTAKIKLEIDKCIDCPYCYKPQGYVDFYCRHDLHSPGIEVGDGEAVPDYCPFVIQRLDAVLNEIVGMTDGRIPKKFINEIERKQRDCPNSRFGADHAWKHINSVMETGKIFLEHCTTFGFSTANTVLKEKYLFWIAALMHDIGLADTNINHAIHSAELAKKYLSRVDIDEKDAATIVHAISNHSDGGETQTIVDAALILADKLDVTKNRLTKDRAIIDNDAIFAEMQKIEKVEFYFFGRDGKAEGAKLRYSTSGDFNVSALSSWPKCVTIPKKVALEYFKVPKFRFFVDDEEIDVKTVFG